MTQAQSEEKLKPPFPWFGGKSRVASHVWDAFGDVDHYVEPFFGSGAVLFARPEIGKKETVNDLDHWVANFWRAVQHAPEKVAHYADHPVNEDDLTARHIWLVKHGMPELAARIPADPDFYDPKIAGWWVWGLCCWIGSGWCSGRGPWTEEGGQIIKRSSGRGVNRQLPHLGGDGRGVNRQRPHLGNDGQGVNRQRPHLGNDGQGVNRENALVEYMLALAERLRRVRVCSGDWSRIVTRGALSHGNTFGIFLDPPYSMELRDTGVYNTDSAGIAEDVLTWCVENGANPAYRIALCGYETEHNHLETLGWRKVSWKAGRAYGRANSKATNNNRLLERIWFNPACIDLNRQKNMF